MDRKQLQRRLLKKAKQQIDENLSEKEVHIIKAIRLLDDLIAVENLLQENLADWSKRNPSGEALKQKGTLEKSKKEIETEKQDLNNYIEKEMDSEMPNFTALATPLIAARLLAQGGSKKRLAFMPSSTMQLLGAEKALFNHLKKKGKSPKHGHIFNHPLLQKLPKQKRGKAARVLAGKLSIAARMDYFGKKKEAGFIRDAQQKVSKV